MRFPVTAIIKSASFSEIIYIERLEIQLNEFIFSAPQCFSFSYCIFLRAWILGTIPGGDLDGGRETSRENRKKRRGRPSLWVEITKFIYFFLRLRIAFRTTARMLAITIPFEKNIRNAVGRLLKRLLLLNLLLQ